MYNGSVNDNCYQRLTDNLSIQKPDIQRPLPVQGPASDTPEEKNQHKADVRTHHSSATKPAWNSIQNCLNLLLRRNDDRYQIYA